MIYIKFYKPDIVHFTYYNNKLSHYIKFRISSSDSPNEKTNTLSIMQIQSFNKKDLIKNAKHIICISNFTKSQLVNITIY